MPRRLLPRRRLHAIRRLSTAVACLGAGLLQPAVASAGGFEIPDTGARALGRGGAMVAGADDLTAMHYNPGALARQRGTTFLYNQNLAFHRATFARAPLTADVWGIDQSFEPVTDRRKVFPFGLFTVVASDFGLRNWTFAAGIYGPSAVGRHDYPAYGPQSFQLTRMDVLLAYYNLSAAWKLRDVFGVGLTVQYVDMIQMKYALVVDSRAVAGLEPSPDAEGTQIETELDLKDRTAATAQLGMWGRPHPQIEIGLASRIVPVFLQPSGGVKVDKPELVTDEVSVTMPLVLPASLRGGVRYTHETGTPERRRKWFDIEVDVVWENWSTVEAFDLELDGAISGQPLSDLRIAKDWKDTVSVRLGGDVFALPPYLTVRAGGYFESATQGNEQAHLDFPAFMRGAAAVGFTAGAKGVYATVGYAHVFQQKQETSEAQGKVFQQRPIAPCPDRCDGLSGVPANAGTLTSSFDLLNFGIELKFAELLAGRRAKRKAAQRPQPRAPAPDPSSSGGAISPPDAVPATPASDAGSDESPAADPLPDTEAPSPDAPPTDANDAGAAGSETDDPVADSPPAAL